MAARAAVIAITALVLGGYPPVSRVPVIARAASSEPGVSVGSVVIVPSSSEPVTMRFPVTLTEPSPAPVSVRYKVVNDVGTTATPGLSSSSGVVRFSSGARLSSSVMRDIDVTIGPQDNGSAKGFEVELSHARGATILNGEASGTVSPDPPSNTVNAGELESFDVSSGPTGTVYVPVTLSDPSRRNIVVRYDTDHLSGASPENYLQAKGSVTIRAGRSEAFVPVRLTDELGPTPTVTFDVDLSKPTSDTLGEAQGTVALATIDDVLTLPSGYEGADLTVDRRSSTAYDTFDVASDDGSFTMTGSPGNVSANSRFLFWPKAAAPSSTQESCATWQSQSPPNGTTDEPMQEGVALRVGVTDGITTGITVMKNVFPISGDKNYATINVLVWDTAQRTPYRQVGQADMSSVLMANGQYLPFPWNVCAEASADTVSFKVWPSSVSEPSWSDASYVSTVTLPPWAEAECPSGFAGWYFGHLHGTSSMTYTNLYAGTPDQ